jgi:hypothetical protein
MGGAAVKGDCCIFMCEELRWFRAQPDLSNMRTASRAVVRTASSGAPTSARRREVRDGEGSSRPYRERRRPSALAPYGAAALPPRT